MDTSNQPNLFARLRNHRLTATFALLATLSAGIIAGSVLTRSVSGKEQTVDSSDARPLVIPKPLDLSTGFAKIAKEVGPAVVNINTESLPKQSANKRAQPLRRRGQIVPMPPNGGDDSQQSPGDMQDFFNRFFGGGNGGDDGDEAGPDGGKREALGSGFIVDSRGYIITNNHVVDKADHIYVKLSTDPDGGPGDHGRPASHRRRRRDRYRRHQDRNQGASTRRQARQLRWRTGRRLGTRHRRTIRPLEDRLRGHCLGQGALYRRARPQRRPQPVPEVHPDRRRHQSRQLRRPAGRYGR